MHLEITDKQNLQSNFWICHHKNSVSRRIHRIDSVGSHYKIKKQVLNIQRDQTKLVLDIDYDASVKTDFVVEKETESHLLYCSCNNSSSFISLQLIPLLLYALI